MSLTVVTYILFFFIYSFVGWTVESIYCSLPAKKFINRGFLFGPICPIYGTGVLCMVVFLDPFANKSWLVFLLGILVCDVVEYITSFVMEKLFHARWWDYTGKFLNIRGRICFTHSIYWGLGSLAVIYIIHPVFKDLMDQIVPQYRYYIITVILVLFALDLFRAIKNALDVKTIMDKLNKLSNNATKVKNLISDNLNTTIDNIQKTFNTPDKSFSTLTKETLSQITDFFSVVESRLHLPKKKPKGYNRMFVDYPTLNLYTKDRMSKLKETINTIKANFNDDEML